MHRSLRAAPALGQALDRDLGPGWRHAAGKSIRPNPPWARIVFAPLPVFLPGVRRVANLSYGDAGRRNRLDVYRRRGAGSGGPVLIHLHGGGFSLAPGRNSFYARRLLFRLARQGWVCVSATDRLAPAASFPDELIDVKKVISWVRAHASEYGGDPARIVLVGSSFGARLATLAGFTANDPAFQPGFEQADTSVAAVVGLYGYYGATDSRQSLPSSPFDSAERGSEALLIVHGEQDTLTPAMTASALAELTRSASPNPVVYAELPGAQHSFDLVSSIRVEAVIDGIEAFTGSVAAPNFSERVDPLAGTRDRQTMRGTDEDAELLVAPRERLRDRPAARVHEHRLDAALASGTPAETSAELALRARRLTEICFRRELARTVRRVGRHSPISLAIGAVFDGQLGAASGGWITGEERLPPPLSKRQLDLTIPGTLSFYLSGLVRATVSTNERGRHVDLPDAQPAG